MLPAFERRPATEAVSIIEPPEYGFDSEVCIIAGAPYFVARNALGRGMIKFVK